MNIFSHSLSLLGAPAFVILLLAGAACGGNDSAPASPAPTPTPTQPAPGVRIVDAYARATTNDVSAIYLTVQNQGTADRLLRASTDVTANTQIHETITEGSASRMQQVAGLDVPANGALTLKPGGYHVMLLDLKSPLVEGQTVQLKLEFERAGTVTVAVPVKPLGATGGMSGGGMGGGGAMGTPTRMP